MRLGIRNVIDWGEVGAMLAQRNDEDQIAFFKAFVKECNSWGTNHQVEQQLACINIKLTPEEISTLSMITYEKEK